jgi:hypothetical protein
MAYFDHLGSKFLLPSWMFSPLTYLVEEHKFLFVANAFHVPYLNVKMKCLMLEKCSSMSICAYIILSWVLNHCMMSINEKSHI